jgi:hypothetical protein
MPANTKLLWKLYPNQVKQDYARRRADQVTPKTLKRPMLLLMEVGDLRRDVPWKTICLKLNLKIRG